MTEENQAEFSQYPPYYYQHYSQVYPGPQNFYQGDPNFYYQGGVNSFGYYPEQGGYPQEYYYPGPVVDPQNYNRNEGYREDQPQSNRGRGQSRGKPGQGSRGRGNQSYRNQMKEDQNDAESIDSKEDVPESKRDPTSRKYSENRNRGRARGYSYQNYQGREFYNRNNSDRNRPGFHSGKSNSRNERDNRNMERNSRYESEESNELSSRNARGQVFSGRSQGNQEYSRNQNFSGGRYQARQHGYDNPRDSHRSLDNFNDRNDGSKTSSNANENYRENSKRDIRRQDNKRNTGGSGRTNSPRHLENESRASFEKRNNPQRNRTDENEISKDKEKNSSATDKKYKFPHDKKFASKKQIERVLAGKVDETQRGVLIEQFTRGTYECMVCCETVKCHHAVWNCPGCFHAFHLICIKKWARSPAAVVEGEGTGWRCPACQKVTEKYPNQYLCFCNKVRDPEYDRMETPHSCGQVCSKNRGDNCTHPCNILCHPGPCPPCNAVVNRTCACGKESKSMKCSITDIVKCERVCGKALNCGKHFCKATCHTGSCQPCEEIIVKECYGSHKKKEVVCGCAESFTKSYCCGDLCKKTLECGNHQCDKVCHADDCKTCETLPEVVTHCPCGAMPLSDLSTVTRKSCTEPIPTCDEICNKSLGCGPQDINVHKCKLKCHEGACGPCDGVTSLTCRCGAIDRDVPCVEVHQYSEENPFTCDRRCNKKRTCGRHKCGQLCCVNEEHVCNQICGRKLSCGLHKCDEPCHRGNCPPCLMTGYDELTCHCESEVMLPPIPCGTKPPLCSKTCVRRHECDHPVYHNCHSEEDCPPCAVLTEKQCMGKHEIRKNIPCHQTNVSCGLPCNKILPCQQHKCTKTCHAGDCQKEGEKCTQPCRVKRKDCNHLCGAPCHSGMPCPQSPCKAEILLMCKCGSKEAKVQCLSGIPQDSAEYQRLTMQTLAGSLQSGQSVDMAQLGKKKKRQLDCDAECAVKERNRRMALALEIRNPDLSAKLGNPTYTDFLKDYAKQNAHFISTVEKALSDLVKNAKQSKHQHRSYPFSPGNRDQRRAIHELAEFYGCETQSYDFEPKKNVVATAYRDKCWLPSVSLTSYVQRELHPKPPVPIPHVHSEATLSQKAKAAKQSTAVLADAKPPSRWNLPDTNKKTSKPEIDYFDFSSN